MLCSRSNPRYTDLAHQRHALSAFTNSSRSSLSRPQTQQEVSALLALSSAAATRQICDVGIVCQRLGKLLLCLDPSDHNQTITTLRDRLADGVGGLGFTLGADDVGLPLLLGLLDDEARALSLLLCDLLVLDCPCELLAEGHVCDRDILKRDIELGGAAKKVGPNAVGNSLSLSDKLCCIELCDDGLEDFVADGWKDTLVVVLAEILRTVISRILVLR